MLLRVLPENVNLGWETLAPMLAQSLPPEIAVSRDILTNNLAAILRDDLVVWVAAEEDDISKYRAVITTCVWDDPISCIKSLMVYHLYVIDRKTPIDVWRDAIRQLKQYGESIGCTRLVAFVDENPAYERFLGQVGADLSTKLVVF